ncbi:MAG: 4-oxalocrotonate decarboxylase [Oxalobacter sp.]|nr:MAG: 4-oxalocrotonate decarboxylase [Oxalobacter sp.]
MASQVNRYAHQLLDARAGARQLSPLSKSEKLTQDDAYDIARRIYDVRIAEGEMLTGRKIGFVNRVVWPKKAEQPTIHTPIWTPIFQSSVKTAKNNFASVSLNGLTQPRFEAEIVFRLKCAPSEKSTMQDLAECIEWMAHGVEITSCPYPDWKFETPDAIAAFGLHGLLVIGEPKTLAASSRSHLASMMRGVSVSVSCNEVLLTAGFGSDILNSPLHALWHLHQMLQNQTRFPTLSAGEIITTGSWNDARPVAPGEFWQTVYAGLDLTGLNIAMTP